MHLHRSSALGYASAASAAHSRVYGACAAEAAASESSGLSVGGCTARGDTFDRTPSLEPSVPPRNTSLAPSRPLCSKITPPPPRATLHALHWMQCQRTLQNTVFIGTTLQRK